MTPLANNNWAFFDLVFHIHIAAKKNDQSLQNIRAKKWFFFLKIFRLNLKFNLVHMFQCTVIHLNDVCNCFLFFITANSLDQLARCRLKNERIKKTNKLKLKCKRIQMRQISRKYTNKFTHGKSVKEWELK